MFQSFWFGDTLSPYEAACMQSFLDHGHRFILYCYTPPQGVPDGVECRDAAQIIGPENYIAYGEVAGAGRGSAALFSNLFRYRLLAEHGGWWVDTDVVCLSREIPETEIFAAYENTGMINNAVLRLPKGHPVAHEAFRETQEVGENAVWGQLGPRLVTALLKAHGLTHFVKPMNLCYPVHYSEALDLLRPSRTDVIRERIRGATFLHLWNEMFRRADIDKSKQPPPGSMLWEIFDRHPVSGWNAAYEPNYFEQGITPEALNRLSLERDHAAALEKAFERYLLNGQVVRLAFAQSLEAERDRAAALEKQLEALQRSEVVAAALFVAGKIQRHAPWLVKLTRKSLRWCRHAWQRRLT